jgi:hypothetical protein
MRHAVDETECDWIGHIDEHQRDRRSKGVDRDRGLRCRGDDNLWTKRNELSQEGRDLLRPGLPETILDLKILPLDVAALT